MKYFAMVDGQRIGPISLEALADAGVGPSTFVWCKGMEDWQHADEVAEICRYWRQRLSGVPAQSPEPTREEPIKDTPAEVSVDNSGSDSDGNNMSRRWFIGPENDSIINPDPEKFNHEPPSMLVWAVLVSLVCMPLTGIPAILFSILASRAWRESQMAEGAQAARLRRSAWDYTRQARMFTGISFFLGMILWAFIFRISL